MIKLRTFYSNRERGAKYMLKRALRKEYLEEVERFPLTVSFERTPEKIKVTSTKVVRKYNRTT